MTDLSQQRDDDPGDWITERFINKNNEFFVKDEYGNWWLETEATWVSIGYIDPPGYKEGNDQ
jgi:hypothetical protein